MSFSRFFLIFVLIIVPNVLAQEHTKVVRLSQIDVQGNERVEKGTILLQISSAIGDDFSPAKTESDIKEVYRTGLFEQVQAKLDRNTGALTFFVKEKPAIRNVFLEGNEEVGEDVLKEKLGINERRFLDTKKIAAGIEEATSYYQGKGFYDTKIDYAITPVEQNQVDLTFTVKEGQEKRLWEVVFEGNLEIDDDDLVDVVATKRYKWWNSWITGTGVIKQEALDNDVKELSHYYLNHGYADINVGEPQIESTDNGLKVVFKINEGPIYSLRSIGVTGDLVDGSVEKTLEGIESTSGSVFNIDVLRKDTFAISEKFTDVGYAFANVEPNTDIDRENKLVDVEFAVNKGALIRVDEINISGNQKTADNVIRRALRMGEQEQYSSSKIKESEQLVRRLGYFEEISITPEPTSVEDHVNLNVSVREAQTGTFSVGAGVSSGEGFLFSVRVSERNIFGTGNALTLNVENGTRNDNFILSFDNPRVHDTRWSFGIDALSTSREYDDFDKNQAGGSVTVGYPLVFLGPEYLDDIRFSLAYELLNIEIDDVERDASQLVKDEEGTSVSSGFTPKLVRDTIDDPLNPQKGSKQLLSVEVAGAGGDEEFWLVNATNTIYYPLLETSIGSFVLSQRVRFGYGETFNDDDFPLFKRYFPGGIDTVRGFDARELGPKDEEGNEYGGSKQLIANIELIFPFFPAIGLKGVVFYDVGNAFDDEVSIDIADLRHAFGWGFRWNSPLGPIRIELGYPVDREEGEDAVQTHFSFGAPL